MKFNIYNQVDSATFEKLKESAGPTAGVFKNKMFFSESGVHVFGKITHVHAEFILNSGERLIEACKMKAKPVKEESKPAVTPTVVTTDYVSSHGKQPAGKGNWIFGLGSKKEDDWIHINDTFANAKKKAIEKAKKAGIAKVYVMESVAAESAELDVVVESVGARAVKARMLAEGREEVGFHVMTESAAMTKACQWLVEKVASIKVEEPKEADTVSTELIKNMIKKYREAVNKEQGIETEEDPLPDGDTEYMDAFVVKDAPKVKGLKTEAVDPKAKLEKQIASLEKKETALRDRLGLARERRRASGKSKGVQGQAEMKLQSKLDAIQNEIAKAKQELKALASTVSSSKEKTVQEATSALSTWKAKVKAKYPKASFEVQKKTDRYSSDRVEAQDGGKVVGYFEKKSGRSNIIESAEQETVTGLKSYQITGSPNMQGSRSRVMRADSAKEALQNYFKAFGGSASKIEVKHADGTWKDITPEGSLRDTRVWDSIQEANEGEADSFSDYDDWVEACREAGATVFKSSDPEDYEAGVRAYYLDGRKPVDVGYWAEGEGQVTRFVEEGLSDLGKGSKTQKFDNQTKWRSAATAAGAVVTSQGGSSLVARIQLKDGSKKTIGYWTGTQGQLTVGSYAVAAAAGFNKAKNFAANRLGADPIVAGAVGVAGAAGNAIAHGIRRLAKKVTGESLADAAAKHLDSM